MTTPPTRTRVAEPPPAAAAPPLSGSRASFGTFASLQVRNFRLLLIGTTLSNAAQWLQQVTLSWLVYDLTGSGTMIGTLNLVRAAAMIGVAPASGAAIDRFSRRNLMVVVALWLLVINVVLGAALVLGHAEVWYLFLFTLLGGLGQAFDMPLRQTVVFVLLPRALAPNGVALIQTGWGLMRSIGPAAGGFFILWFGPGGNFLIQAVAFGLIALNSLLIQFPPHQAGAARAPMLRNIKEGLAYVARERVTRTFLLMSWVLPIVIVPMYTALPPIYARKVYDGGPEVLGLLLSSVGVGCIVGGLVAASLGRIDRRGLVQLASLFLTSLSLIAFALTRSLWQGLLLMGLSGVFEIIFLTGNQTLLQLSIPDSLRGRVTSITTLSAGLVPMGALFAGAGADLIGPMEITLVMSGIGAAIAVGIFIWVPLVRNYRISQAIATH